MAGNLGVAFMQVDTHTAGSVTFDDIGVYSH